MASGVPPFRRGVRWRSGRSAEDALGRYDTSPGQTVVSKLYRVLPNRYPPSAWAGSVATEGIANGRPQGCSRCPEKQYLIGVDCTSVQSARASADATLDGMGDRKKPLLLAAALAFVPTLLVWPTLGLARFQQTGPQRVWPILCYAPLAMWIEIQALRLLMTSYRDRRDPFLIAILPIALFAASSYAVCAGLFLFNLPALLYRFI